MNSCGGRLPRLAQTLTRPIKIWCPILPYRFSLAHVSTVAGAGASGIDRPPTFHGSISPVDKRRTLRPHHPFSAVRGRERQISDWPSLGFTGQLSRDRLGVVSDRATSPVNCTTCYCLSGRLITVRTPRASVDFIESPPVQSRPAQCPAAPSCLSGSSAVCESPRGSLKSEISSLAQAAMHFC